MNANYLANAIQDEVSRGRTLEEAIDVQRKAGFPLDVVEAGRALYESKVQSVKSYTAAGLIIDRDRRDWYGGPRPSDTFWPVLTEVMSDKGWDDDIIGDIDGASNRIVGLLDEPGKRSFNTRGLVLGHVQSGKTANFTAVMAKAADAGFKLFIVLAGLHNSLRQQTQKRLRDDLYDKTSERWLRLTSTDDDFRADYNSDSYLSGAGHQRVLCVVKKNATRLRALRDWLRRAKPSVLQSCPALVIDDEADQASVDAARYETERTVINSLIIEILAALPRVAYVGYTATPFANVLADTTYPSDLYPRDFIVDLPQPAGYFGNERIFGAEAFDEESEDDGLDVIREVPEEEVHSLKPRRRDEREDFIPEITDSLRTAIHWFLLACAVRRARGQGDEHMSMLVHTCVYTAVHAAFGPVLETELQSIEDRFLAEDVELIEDLSRLWVEETRRLPAAAVDETPVGFDEALDRLGEVFDAVSVTIENAQSEHRLEYPDDRATTQIIVGGSTLSRGLTLKGLAVSFFVRSTYLYDTLLQMGRWFGYRHGYSDLPRIWMTAELEQHFRHLALVEQEIRRDIARMEQLNLTPQQFAVRVRTHSTMAVTSPLKMKYAREGSISFGGQTKQTTYYQHRDVDWLDANIDAARTLLAGAHEIRGPERVWGGRHLLYRGVPLDVVRPFLRAYRIHERHRDIQPAAMLQYIEEQHQDGHLGQWNIAVVGQLRGVDWAGLLPDGTPVKLLTRARIDDRDPTTAYLKAIMSTSDRAIDFGWADPTRGGEVPRERGSGYTTRLSEWRDGRDPVSGRPLDPQTPGMHAPLLLLYPIDKDSRPRGQREVRTELNAARHIVGLAIVFPGSSRLTPQSYVMADLSSIDRDVDTPDEEDIEP